MILFLRKPRELVPTPAASVLAHEWHSIITTVEQSLEKAHTAQDGARRTLNLGLIDSSSVMDQSLDKCLDRFEQANPNIDIHVEKMDMHELVERLNAGDVDIICTGHHEGAALDAYHLPWKCWSPVLWRYLCPVPVRCLKRNRFSFPIFGMSSL